MSLLLSGLIQPWVLALWEDARVKSLFKPHIPYLLSVHFQIKKDCSSILPILPPLLKNSIV